MSELFRQARDLSSSAREAFVASVTAEDPAMGTRLRGLLGADSTADVRGPSEAAPASWRIPSTIGRYTLIRELGAGGMGIVYEARQEQPRRTVALKIIRPGSVRPDAERRFVHEAEMLGQLQHPGIASIFEAGTVDEGGVRLSYFAMESIAGEPIDRYCTSRALPVDERLELVARIGDAVQHAHERGVVHRDLKPANILVTADGQPKILDFGVARATDLDLRTVTLQTEVGQLVGTVPYMSPEQASADAAAIDARTDVYALGVLLFELLTGRLPLAVRDRAIHDAVLMIRTEEPTRLGEVDPTLRGEIDTIIAKSLEKDPRRRYQSAEALSSEIRRYLRHEPILARPPSAAYQVRKFAQRHRVLVTGLAAVFLALLIGVVGTGLALVQVLAERDAKESALRRAEAINRFLHFDVLAQAAPGRGGPDMTARELLDAAAATLDGRFGDDPVIGASLRSTIGNVYVALGEYDRAMPLLERARADFVEALGPDDPLTLDATSDLGAFALEVGLIDDARTWFTVAAAGRERVQGAEHPATLNERANLGAAMIESGDDAAGTALLEAVLAAQRRTIGAAHPQTRRTIGRLGAAAIGRGHAADALPRLEEAMRLAIEAEGERSIAAVVEMNNVAVAYEGLGRLDEAVALYDRVLAIEADLRGEAHPQVLATMHNLARAYEVQGRIAEAEAMYRRTLDRCRRVLPPTHPGAMTCLRSLAGLYLDDGRAADAERCLLEAVELAAMLPQGQIDAATLRCGLAAVCDRRGDPEGAVEHLRAAVDAVATLPRLHGLRVNATGMLGQALLDAGRPADAERYLLDAYEAMTEAGIEPGFSAAALVDDLVVVYTALGRADEAEQWAARRSGGSDEP